MIQSCKHCQHQYDVLKQSSLCPHNAHPSLCKAHDRMNCGNKECGPNSSRDNVREIKRKEA